MEQDISKYTAKDTVFRDLFSDKEYVAQLYAALTLEEIVMASLYNDVGFMINDKIIILVECQSTWTENIIIRLLMYLVETYYRYYRQTEQSLYSTKKVDFPKPELYVIYVGKEKINKEYISLSDSFLNGEECDLNIKVKVITDGKKGDIISQYVRFTQIFNEQVQKHDRTRKAVSETIRICTNENVLKNYMKERESEVASIMLNMFDVERELEIYFKTEKREIEHKKAIAVAKDMLEDGFSIDAAAKYSKLSVDEVTALANGKTLQLV